MSKNVSVMDCDGLRKVAEDLKHLGAIYREEGRGYWHEPKVVGLTAPAKKQWVSLPYYSCKIVFEASQKGS
jgi:hypothetical protein